MYNLLLILAYLRKPLRNILSIIYLLTLVLKSHPPHNLTHNLMTKSLIIFLFFNLFFFKLSAQINLEGKIYFDNKPKSNVTVYLNNTTIGTITNNRGEFNLEVKNGVYQLIISHIGFKAIKYDFDTSTYTNPIIFSLTEEEYDLDEIVVNGKQNNDEREYNLSVFLREFIGTSDFSKFCTIQNPDVLFFEFDAENNILTAEAVAPLHIKNEALGYEIFYDLKHFSLEKKTAKYLGFSYFKEIKGKKNNQKKWNKNRLKAYNGSQIHFYKSVLNNTAKEEGFVINLFARKKNKDRPNQEELLKARKALVKSNAVINFSRKNDKPKNSIDSALITLKKAKLPKYVDYLYKSDIAASDIIRKNNNKTYLQFDNNLRITYLKEKEEKGYILRNPFSKLRKAFPQTSNIIPLTEKSIIYSKGILANPLNVLYEEYWSYEKFAHSLPLDYEPNNKN